MTRRPESGNRPKRRRGVLRHYHRPLWRDRLFWLVGAMSVLTTAAVVAVIMVITGVPDSPVSWLRPILLGLAVLLLSFRLLGAGVTTSRHFQRGLGEGSAPAPTTSRPRAAPPAPSWAAPSPPPASRRPPPRPRPARRPPRPPSPPPPRHPRPNPNPADPGRGSSPGSRDPGTGDPRRRAPDHATHPGRDPEGHRRRRRPLPRLDGGPTPGRAPQEALTAPGSDRPLSPRRRRRAHDGAGRRCPDPAGPE